MSIATEAQERWLPGEAGMGVLALRVVQYNCLCWRWWVVEGGEIQCVEDVDHELGS